MSKEDACLPVKRLHHGDTIKFADPSDGRYTRTETIVEIKKLKGKEGYRIKTKAPFRFDFGEFADDIGLVKTITLLKQWSHDAKAYVDVANPTKCNTRNHFKPVVKKPEGYVPPKKSNLLGELKSAAEKELAAANTLAAHSTSESSSDSSSDLFEKKTNQSYIPDNARRLYDHPDSDNEYEYVRAALEPERAAEYASAKYPFWAPVYAYTKGKRTMCKKHKRRKTNKRS
jgi:hypothetical protein